MPKRKSRIIGTSFSDYPDGFPLGKWIFNQRQKCVDPERRKKLESLPGWSWNPDTQDQMWNTGYELTKKYGAVSVDFQVDGYLLGRWQDRQRQICKDPERRKKLETIEGWIWNRDEAAWQRGYELTKKYGIVPLKYKVDGYLLGRWQIRQRQICKDPKRRELLEELPGWEWNTLDAKWNRGFELTKKYGLVSRTARKEEFNLGYWQELQKERCKDPERRGKLETIKGWKWFPSNA